MDKYQLGSKPSPPDEKDYSLTKIVGLINVFPEEFRIIYNGNIKDQGLFPTCVGYSLSYCCETIESKQSGRDEKLSPGFIYANRELTDYQGEGMYPREALKNLQKYGIVEYDLFPYNNYYYTLKNKLGLIKDELISKAQPHQITTYCRLFNDNEIKNALMQLGPVTICIPVSDNFYNLSETNIVPMPNNINVNSYHEVTIFGWRKDNTWIIFNSWGEGWGDYGKCYIPFSFPIVEAWSITDTNFPLHEEVNPVNQKYWRVQLGGYKYKENALKKQEEVLIKTGQKTYLIFIGGLYKVQLGAFSIESNAKKLSEEMKGIGYDNFITYY